MRTDYFVTFRFFNLNGDNIETTDQRDVTLCITTSIDPRNVRGWRRFKTLAYRRADQLPQDRNNEGCTIVNVRQITPPETIFNL